MNTSSLNNSQFREEESIDFKRYFSLFLSNWYWFAVALFLALSIAYGINRYSEKVHHVSASLLILDSQLGGGASELNNIFTGSQVIRSQQVLKNEIGILRSFSLNKRVIDSLPDFHITYNRVGRRNIVERRLYKDTPFIVVPEPGYIQPSGIVSIRFIDNNSGEISINGKKNSPESFKIGHLFDNYGYKFRIIPRLTGQQIFSESLSNKYSFRFERIESLANSYRGGLSINPIDESASLVVLSTTGSVPEQVADYLNTLMELYILQGLELKNQTADSTISFIKDQLDTTKVKLNNTEDDLEEFRRGNRLIDLSSEGALIQNRIERYESEKSIIELQRKYYNYLNDYFATGGSMSEILSPTIMGLTDQILIGLIQQLLAVQKRREELSMNLNSTSTPILIVDEEIKKIKEAIHQNINSGILKLDISLQDMNLRIKEVEHEISQLPLTEQQLIRIQRQLDINSTVYTFLLEKQAEAGIARASNISDNRIIDKATSYSSYQIKPQKRKNNIMAFVFGLLFPAIGIILIDLLNNKIIDRRDVEKGTSAPIIGYVGHNDTRSELPVYNKPGSTFAESFRSVRTNLGYLVKDSDNPVIAVSSTLSAEGKTFVAINLATILAMLGKKVLLVGLDLRKPRIHKVLKVENDVGMSNYLVRQNTFESIIKETEIENLFYAPAGPVPPNPAELIASSEMKSFIARAKQEFDYVIIDTPPLAIVTDALLISELVASYLLVVRQRYTSKNTLSLIQELYDNKTLKNLGLVINDISRTGYYGYGLRYGHYSGYGYTYGYKYYDSGGYGGYLSSRNKKDSGYYTE